MYLYLYLYLYLLCSPETMCIDRPLTLVSDRTELIPLFLLFLLPYVPGTMRHPSQTIHRRYAVPASMMHTVSWSSHPQPFNHWWASFVVRIHLQTRRPGFDHWVGKIPWRRERLATPVFWPGEFHGLYSPWGCKELDTTERLSLSLGIWEGHSISKGLGFFLYSIELYNNYLLVVQ